MPPIKSVPSVAEQERLLQLTQEELRGTSPADEAGRAGVAEGYSEPERNVAAGGSEAAAKGAGLQQADGCQ
jgi:hypothetical protein